MKTEQQQNYKGFRWSPEAVENFLRKVVGRDFLPCSEVKRILTDQHHREMAYSPALEKKIHEYFPTCDIQSQGKAAGKKYKFVCPELANGGDSKGEKKIESESESEKGYKRNFINEERPELLYAILCLIAGNGMGMDMDISSLVRGLQINTYYPFNVRKTVIERLSKGNNFTLTGNGQNVRFQSVDGVWMPQMVEELWYIPVDSTVMKLVEMRDISLTIAEDVGLSSVYRITYPDLISVRDKIIDIVIATSGKPMLPGGTQPLTETDRRNLWRHSFNVSIQRLGWWRDPFAHLPSRTNMTQEKANFLFRKGEKKLHELLMK